MVFLPLTANKGGQNEENDAEQDESYGPVYEIPGRLDPRHRRSQLAFHDFTQDHAQNDRDNGKIQALQDKSKYAEARSDRAIRGAVAKGENTDKSEYQNDDA